MSPNGPDKRMILGIVFFFLFYFGWQNYLAKKYPQPAKTQSTIEPTKENPGASSPALDSKGTPRDVEAKRVETVQREEKFFSYSDDKVDFSVSSRGLGLTHFQMKSYVEKDSSLVQLGHTNAQRLFEMRIGDDQALDFDVTESEKGVFRGVALMGGMRIERELRYDPRNYSFSNSVKIEKPSPDIFKAVSFYIPEKIRAPQSKSFLFPSYEQQDFFVSHENTHERVNINHAKENVQSQFSSTQLVSLSTQYFSAALLDRSEIIPEVHLKAEIASGQAMAEVRYRPPQNEVVSLSQTLFAGPKSIDLLKGIDPKMAEVLDFGFLKFISQPLLYMMKWLYTIVSNWGVAIILLTLFVRLLVLPFNIMATRSMKAMQKIQPMMTSLRERYKDDPLKMNQEVMALMKEHKANPLGGCLPTLLQIPVFFALYRVIGSSIELYQSPFMLWIQDLSAHDKFFVLPVLMGLTMFIQQKLTPTAMDPTQAKILAFMPLIFTVFMLQLPSGLTLYMFVSALFGITQQWFMLRGSRA